MPAPSQYRPSGSIDEKGGSPLPKPVLRFRMFAFFSRQPSYFDSLILKEKASCGRVFPLRALRSALNQYWPPGVITIIPGQQKLPKNNPAHLSSISQA